MDILPCESYSAFPFLPRREYQPAATLCRASAGTDKQPRQAKELEKGELEGSIVMKRATGLEFEPAVGLKVMTSTIVAGVGSPDRLLGMPEDLVDD